MYNRANDFDVVGVSVYPAAEWVPHGVGSGLVGSAGLIVARARMVF